MTANAKKWFDRWWEDYRPYLEPRLFTEGMSDTEITFRIKYVPKEDLFYYAAPLARPKGFEVQPGNIILNLYVGEDFPNEIDGSRTSTHLDMLICEMVSWQITSQLQTGHIWIDAGRGSALAYRMADWAANNALRYASNRWNGWTGIFWSDLTNSLGPNILAGHRWPYGSVEAGENNWWAYNAIDNTIASIWYLLAEASGRDDFFAQFNQAYLARGEPSIKAVGEILDDLVKKIDGVKPSIWLTGRGVTIPDPKDGIYLGVYQWETDLLPILVKREGGVVSYPDLEQVYVLEIKDTEGKLIKLPWRENPFYEAPDHLIDPYFPVTLNEGNSLLENLPPGLYRLKVSTELDGKPYVGNSYVLSRSSDSPIKFTSADPKVDQVTINEEIVQSENGLFESGDSNDSGIALINGREYTIPKGKLPLKPTPYQRWILEERVDKYVPVFPYGNIPYSYQGLALANPSSTGKAQVHLQYWQDGLMRAVKDVELEEHTQIPRQIHEWLGIDPPTGSAGYLKITAHADVQAFYVWGNNMFRAGDGGNSLVRWGKRFLLPPGTEEITVLNTGENQVVLDRETRGLNGALTNSPVTREAATVIGGSATRFMLTSVPQTYTVVSTDNPVFIIAKAQSALAGSTEFMLTSGFDLDRLITGPTSFPHFAVNGGWDTEVSLYNFGDAGSVRLIQRDDAGNQIASAEVVLGTEQALIRQVRELFQITGNQLVTGEIEIVPTAGMQIAGFVSFFREGGVQSILTLPRPTWDATLNQVATALDWFTGVVIKNVLDVAVDIWVRVFREGKILGENKITLSPRQRIARQIWELIPEAQKTVGGYIHISAVAKQPPIIVTGLYGHLKSNLMIALDASPQ